MHDPSLGYVGCKIKVVFLFRNLIICIENDESHDK